MSGMAPTLGPRPDVGPGRRPGTTGPCAAGQWVRAISANWHTPGLGCGDWSSAAAEGGNRT